MRLKIIAVLCLMLFLASLAMAQEGGGKPLPGEGETPTVTSTVTAVATGSSPETEATPTATATLPAEPTQEEPTAEAEIEFPAEMLADANIEVGENELVLYEPFDEEDAWELGDYESGTMEIDDGVYVIENASDGVLWGQNQEEHSNVIIQVTTEQLSDADDNGFGIMCRADTGNNLDAYHFWISGDGFATIFKFVDDGEEFVSIEEWVSTDTINQGQDTNVITAVCADEYLALFVNGELIIETSDDEYSEGVTGLGVSIFEDDENVEVAFDDVYIWEIDDFTTPEVEASEPEEDPTEENSSELDPDEAAEDVVDALEEGDVAIELGDILVAEDFSEEGDWGILDENGSIIEVGDGVYFFEEPNAQLFTWSQDFSAEVYEDVVISVDTRQLSEEDDNAYGVMCRLEPDTDDLNGYTFIIGGDGDYIMGYWEDGDFTTINEDSSDAINQGQDTNTIYAVCVGEYFALYANGELVDEFEDDTFDSGVTGVGVISFADETVSVEFDNLYIWEAED